VGLQIIGPMPSATCWDRGFADSPLEETGFELPVPPPECSSLALGGGQGQDSAELRPIDPRRCGIIRAVVGLGKPIELLRRLEEPPLTVE
jgi:hypothetical protein